MDTDTFIAEVLTDEEVKYVKFSGEFGQYADVVYKDDSVGMWYRKNEDWRCHESYDYAVRGGSVLFGREC